VNNVDTVKVPDWNPREEFESRRKIMALYKDSPIMGMADYERLLTAFEEARKKAKCWDEAKEPGEFGGFIDLDREMVEELEKKHGVGK
jgi:hypothetical protein